MREEKYHILEQKLRATGVPQSNIRQMPGVNGSALNLEKLLEDDIMTQSAYMSILQHNKVVGGHFLTFGSFGCYLAHVNVWREAVKQSTPVLVLEDDVDLVENFWAELKLTMGELPWNWDRFYAGLMLRPPSSRRDVIRHMTVCSLFYLGHLDVKAVVTFSL
eukprot:gene5296-7068_t